MTNDKIRRNDEIPMTKPASAHRGAFRHSNFGFLSLFVIRHSSFAFLCAFLGGFGWQPPACRASSALGTWLSSQTNIQTWSATVIQTRTLKALTEPLTATGRVWFAAPDRFRWELGEPPRTIAVRRAGEMLILYPNLKRVERYPLAGEGAGPWRDTLALLEAGFPRGKAELESRFRVVGEQAMHDVHEVTLQPRSASARRLIPQIRIAFGIDDFSLRATELQFADGSRMRNDFTNGVLNPKLEESIFAPRLDPRFKVIEPFKQK